MLVRCRICQNIEMIRWSVSCQNDDYNYEFARLYATVMNSQGHRSNQCHRAMARVDFLPRPESQYIYWAPEKKTPWIPSNPQSTVCSIVHSGSKKSFWLKQDPNLGQLELPKVDAKTTEPLS